MKNEKQTSNLNFNVQLFWKSENHLFWCFLSQLQYGNENQNFISNFTFQFIKKNEMALWVHGAIWTCSKFWRIKNIFRKLQANESLILNCLQIYRELLSCDFSPSSFKLKWLILTLLTKYVSLLKNYLSYQTEIFLAHKLLENLLLAKHLISVAATSKKTIIYTTRNF